MRRLLLLLLLPSIALAFEPVETRLSQESASQGEGVNLVITLRSQGTFSGVPGFELPRLPQTSIVREGRPVIGSERVREGGQVLELFTQQHTFVLYSQQSGTLAIPAFRVSFATSVPGQEPVPVVETTRPLSLELDPTRPFMDVTARGYKLTQTWRPDPETTEFEPGDVLERVIEQVAEGTTAMLLPEPRQVKLPGIRVYRESPQIKDQTQRGASTATRVDRIRYQFEQGGSFTLPSMTVAWWDLKNNREGEARLDGRELEVNGGDFGPDHPVIKWVLFLLIVALLIAGVRLRRRRNRKRVQPENLQHQLMQACLANDANLAFRLGLRWQRSQRLPEPWKGLWLDLIRCLYSRDQQIWQGDAMADFLQRYQEPEPVSELPGELPPLNMEN